MPFVVRLDVMRESVYVLTDERVLRKAVPELRIFVVRVSVDVDREAREARKAVPELIKFVVRLEAMRLFV